MIHPQEGSYTKIAAIAGVIGVVIAFFAWIHPFDSHSNTLASGSGAKAPSETPAQSPSSNHSEPPSYFQKPAADPSSDSRNPPKGPSEAGLTSGGEGGSQSHHQIDPAKLKRTCGIPENVNLRPGMPTKVASGLAVLSVKTAQEGSEPYLTLSIASDRDTLAKSVLGAPEHYSFATSQGAYFVNVVDADLATGAMTVQVGCEAKENMP